MPEVLLEARSLAVSYGGVRALAGIDVQVRDREAVAFLGRNGAGKTTTLRALAGLSPVAAGAVLFQGRDITRRPACERARRGIGLVPEGRGMFPGLTVRENLEMGAYRRRVAKREVADDIARVLEDFPALANRLGQSAASLSGGEQQMLALARGLMARPTILLVDELSLGLAPVVVERLYEVLGRLRERGMTLAIVEQHVGLALEFADRAYVLEKGRVVLAREARTLASDPELVKAYLSDESATRGRG